MGTITGIISMVMSLYCYAYCGTNQANTSPLEKPKIEGQTNGSEKL